MMKRLFRGICLALLLVTLSACGPYSTTPGSVPKPELRDGTVQKVMAYLHAKDAAGLESMAPGNFIEVEEATNGWIRKWGGVDESDYQVCYESPGGTTVYDTTIKAKSADSSATEIRIWLSWAEDRWTVGPLGRHPNPVVTATPNK